MIIFRFVERQMKDAVGNIYSIELDYQNVVASGILE
jgi:hypothetical protein